MSEYKIINELGTTFYYKDKEKTILHRVDGPAIEWYDGDKDWYLNGKLHRSDGPAAVWNNGRKKGWFINGVFIFEIDNNGKVISRMK